MLGKNLKDSWSDVGFYLFIIIILVCAAGYLEKLMIIPGLLLLAAALYYSYRHLHGKEIIFSGYMDNVVRNIERANHYAVRNMDTGMAVFGREGKLQWCNEIFRSMLGKKNLNGKRPEEILPLDKSAFETLCVKDGERFFEIGKRFYLMRYFSVKTKEEERKKEVQAEDSSGLMVYLTDVTELELLKKRFKNEKLCLLYLRFDNYEDVVKGLSETARANIDAAVGEAVSKWVDNLHGFSWRAGKENAFAGMNQASLELAIKDKFSILDRVREIKLGNKFAPTLSIGASVDGSDLSEVALKASRALELALGRGGDQAVVISGDQNQFFGGTSAVGTKNTRVRSRIVAHNLREKMLQADNIFVMGHVNEDYDAIGSSIGVAKLALSLGKPTYIVSSGESVSMDRISDMLKSGDMDALEGSSGNYLSITLSESKALPLIGEGSLLVLCDHHRQLLCASKKVLAAIPTNRIIIDHHRRSEDVIQHTVLSYMEPSSSSASELVTELTGYFDDGLEFSRAEATALYAGIVVDTKNFAVQTGARTFEAAALLRSSGADPKLVRQLFKDDLESSRERFRLIAAAEMPSPGVAISVNRSAEKNSQTSIIAAQAADVLININGIVVGAVINEYKDGSLGISARSDGTVNVQVIMEELGGGGHQTVAGVQIKNMRADDVVPRIVALAKKQLDEIDSKEREILGIVE